MGNNGVSKFETTISSRKARFSLSTKHLSKFYIVLRTINALYSMINKNTFFPLVEKTTQISRAITHFTKFTIFFFFFNLLRTKSNTCLVS